MITISEFRKLPYIEHFNLYNYDIRCICPYVDVRWNILENWKVKPQKVVNGMPLGDFNVEEFNNYDEDLIKQMFVDIMDIDASDITITGKSVIIRNFDQYQNNLDDLVMDKIDLENNIIYVLLSDD